VDKAGGGHSTDSELPALAFVGRLTEDDAVNLNRCHCRLLYGPGSRITLGFVLCLPAVGLLLLLATRPFSVWEVVWEVVGAINVSLIYWAFLLFITPLPYDQLVRLAYRLNPERYQETQVTLMRDEIGVDNDHHRSEFRWNLVSAVVDEPAGLLFCGKGHQPLFWLPDRLFEGSHLRQRVLALAERNAVPVRSHD
jgi:hypothetical protein